jgi:ribosome-binding protein aMBF1 (putative translation factor)
MIYKALYLRFMIYYGRIGDSDLREQREVTTMAVVTVGRTPLAERIILERAARGWSQAELAERAGVSPSTVALAETGGSKTSPRSLYRIARALELDPIELLRLPQEAGE